MADSSQLKYEKALEYEIFVKGEYSFSIKKIKNAKCIFDIWWHVWFFTKWCRNYNKDVEIHYFEPVGDSYNKALKAFDPGEKYFITPKELPNSTHVYHQYTLKIKNGKRDELKAFLADTGIPSMIYYPLPLQEQEAFKPITRAAEELDKSKACAYSVLSLPIHTEMTKGVQDIVIEAIKTCFS